MRRSFQNILDNNLRKMFNVNRNYINQEINRLGSVSQRETSYRRNGMLDFGAMQMKNLTGGANFATVGCNLVSPVVGH